MNITQNHAETIYDLSKILLYFKNNKMKKSLIIIVLAVIFIL